MSSQQLVSGFHLGPSPPATAPEVGYWMLSCKRVGSRTTGACCDMFGLCACQWRDLERSMVSARPHMSSSLWQSACQQPGLWMNVGIIGKWCGAWWLHGISPVDCQYMSSIVKLKELRVMVCVAKSQGTPNLNFNGAWTCTLPSDCSTATNAMAGCEGSDATSEPWESIWTCSLMNPSCIHASHTIMSSWFDMHSCMQSHPPKAQQQRVAGTFGFEGCMTKKPHEIMLWISA